MDLQAEKLELLKLVINTDYESIISKATSLFKKSRKAIDKEENLSEFMRVLKTGFVM